MIPKKAGYVVSAKPYTHNITPGKTRHHLTSADFTTLTPEDLFRRGEHRPTSRIQRWHHLLRQKAGKSLPACTSHPTQLTSTHPNTRKPPLTSFSSYAETREILRNPRRSRFPATLKRGKLRSIASALHPI